MVGGGVCMVVDVDWLLCVGVDKVGVNIVVIEWFELVVEVVDWFGA